MKYCQICGHQSEPDGQLQCECLNRPIENDHIVDANKKVPWADEPTLTCDGVDFIAFRGPRPYDNVVVGVDVEVSRNIERRMRAAERLLETATVDPACAYIAKEWIQAKYDHLKAAKKEDGR